MGGRRTARAGAGAGRSGSGPFPFPGTSRWPESQSRICLYAATPRAALYCPGWAQLVALPYPRKLLFLVLLLLPVHLGPAAENERARAKEPRGQKATDNGRRGAKAKANRRGRSQHDPREKPSGGPCSRPLSLCLSLYRGISQSLTISLSLPACLSSPLPVSPQPTRAPRARERRGWAQKGPRRTATSDDDVHDNCSTEKEEHREVSKNRVQPVPYTISPPKTTSPGAGH